MTSDQKNGHHILFLQLATNYVPRGLTLKETPPSPALEGTEVMFKVTSGIFP